MSALASPIDRLRQIGGSVYLDGDKLRYRIPATDEARQLVQEAYQRTQEFQRIAEEKLPVST